jgi:hypothetical protein
MFFFYLNPVVGLHPRCVRSSVGYFHEVFGALLLQDVAGAWEEQGPNSAHFFVDLFLAANSSKRTSDSANSANLLQIYPLPAVKFYHTTTCKHEVSVVHFR